VLSNHRKIVEAGLLPQHKAAAEVGLELVEIWKAQVSMQRAFAAMRGWRRSDRADAGYVLRHPKNHVRFRG
jgi:hypothetical protein